jgi:U3 small nucleolar RNA-associated protein 10
MNSLILTFLPYHTTPIFLNLLTILPEDLTPAFKALFPYKRSRINPPRAALVRSAAKNPPFVSALNRYVLEASRQRAHYHGLLTFWAGIMTEAASDMLDSARAGRRGVEKQNHEDILIRFLPVLNDGFSMKKVSELVIGCYMITVVFATKAALKDNVIDSLMEAVVGSWTPDTINTGFVCLAFLAQHKEDVTLPTKVVRSVLKSDNFMDMLHEVSAHHKTSQLLLGLISGCLRDLEKQDSQRQMSFIMSVFDRALLDEAGNRKAITNILQTATDSSKRGTLSLDMQAGISEIVQKLNSSNNFRPILQAITSESVIDVTALEASLQTVIETQPALPAIEDVAMEDADDQKEPDVYLDLIQSLAKESLYSSSFLAEPASTVFEKLVQVLTLAAESSEKLEEFSNLPVLGKTYLADKPQYLSFFTKVFAGSHSLRPRAAALKVVAASLKNTNLAIDLQGLLPYIIVALADSSSTIRREAANLVATLVDLQRKAKKEGEPRIWAHDSIYGQKKQAKSIQWLSSRDAQKIVDRVLVSGLEGYVLDPSHINVSIQKALKSSSVSDSTNDSSGNELRKSLRQSLFSFLCSHIVHTPLYGVKFQLLKVVNAVDKVGSLTRTKELTPVLEKWHTLSEKEVAQVCEDEHLPSNELEEEILAIVSAKDKDAESILISNVENAGGNVRRAFVSAAFGRLEQIWNRLGEDRQVSASQKVFDLSFQGNQTIQANAKNVLRNVELPSAVLVQFLETIPTYITTLESHSPSPKKRRTNQNNAVASLPNQAELDEVMQKTTYILELVDSSAPENHPETSEGLFKALAAIHHFKSQIGSGMGYLLSLALGSLLAIVNKLKVSKSFA